MKKTPRGRCSFLLPLIIFLLLVAAGCTSREMPVAGKGTLDLSGVNFLDLGPVPLQGDWNIYWKQFINPQAPLEKLPDPSGLFTMPHSWNEWRFEENTLGGEGYGSFTLGILLPRDIDEIGIYIPNASTAYALFADGRKVASSGTPGTTESSSIPRYRIQTAKVPVVNGSIRLVLHVSNFHHRRGGMWKPLLIGTVSQIESHNMIETMYDFLLLGNFIALGVYNVMLYFSSRRKPTVSILLGVFFGVLALRVLVMGQMLITQLFPHFPWVLQLKIEYLTSHLIPLLIVQIINILYPGKLDRKITFCIYVFVMVNILIMLVAPVLFYSKIVFIYLIGLLCGLTAATAQFIVNFLKGDKSSLIMAGVIILILFVVFGDSVHNWELILSRDFAPFGFILSLFSNDTNISNSVYLLSTLITVSVFFLAANLLAITASRKALKVQENLGDSIDWNRLHEEFKITKREKELLVLVVRGMSNKEIGNTLFISEGTVKNHLHNIMRKLNVRNRTELSSRVRSRY